MKALVLKYLVELIIGWLSKSDLLVSKLYNCKWSYFHTLDDVLLSFSHKHYLQISNMYKKQQNREMKFMYDFLKLQSLIIDIYILEQLY